jgi:hypothetical protein
MQLLDLFPCGSGRATLTKCLFGFRQSLFISGVNDIDDAMTLCIVLERSSGSWRLELTSPRTNSARPNVTTIRRAHERKRQAECWRLCYPQASQGTHVRRSAPVLSGKIQWWRCPWPLKERLADPGEVVKFPLPRCCSREPHAPLV